MLSVIVIAVFTFLKRLGKLHEDIGGRWINYVCNLIRLKSFKKCHPKGRMDLHNVFGNSPYHNGYYPFAEEIQFAKPKPVSLIGMKVNI